MLSEIVTVKKKKKKIFGTNIMLHDDVKAQPIVSQANSKLFY